MRMQNIKNTLMGTTQNERLLRGSIVAAGVGVGAVKAAGLLATKGVITIIAGGLLTATGWGLIALAVAGIALAVFGAIQPRRERLEIFQELPTGLLGEEQRERSERLESLQELPIGLLGEEQRERSERLESLKKLPIGLLDEARETARKGEERKNQSLRELHRLELLIQNKNSF